MPRAVDLLLSPPFDRPASPRWIEPEAILIDDVHGPAALREFASAWGGWASSPTWGSRAGSPTSRQRVRHPDRIRIFSGIDPENALPDRLLADEALMAFAEQHGIVFERDECACREGCSPSFRPGAGWVVAASRGGLPQVGAAGGLSLAVQPTDIAAALATGQIWAGRPAVETVELIGGRASGVGGRRQGIEASRHQGSPPHPLIPPATVHDLAIVLRPLLTAGRWIGLVGSGVDVGAWDMAPASRNGPPTPLKGRGNPVPQAASRIPSAGLAPLIALLNDSPAALVFRWPDGLRDSRPNAVARVDLSSVAPMVQLLDTTEDHSQPTPRFVAVPVVDLETRLVDRIYIGSCTTGSVEDLRLAAEALDGQRVRVPTVIAPASQADLRLLSEVCVTGSGRSLEEVFRNAGCDLGLPGCAACVNALSDLDQADRADRPLTVVATAVANVTTRRAAQVLTASPITAARAAVSGKFGG